MKSLKTSLAFILPNYRPKTRIGPHNEEILEVIVGSLLGEGHAERLPSGGVRISFKQGAVHKDYLFWLFSFFSTRGYCSNILPVKSLYILGNKMFEFYRFSTYAFSSFIYIHNLFYNNKKKVIPYNIADFLTSLALAI